LIVFLIFDFIKDLGVDDFSSFLSVDLVGWQVGLDVKGTGPSRFSRGKVAESKKRLVNRVVWVCVASDVLNQCTLSRLGLAHNEN